MSKISVEEMLDYADGKLDAARRAAVEAHLRSHAEDAQLLADMKLAGAALRAWDAELPRQASENFWPQLREQLPAQPGRAVWRRLGFKGWTLPAWRLSLGAAVAAAVIAMIVFMSAPQQSVSPTMADAPALSAADRAFVTQSLQRHEAYAGQPFNGALGIPATPGNARSDEGDDYESDEYIP